MSGNEPNWNEDAEHEAAGDLYGAPRRTPASSADDADGVAPLGFVAPLSIDDDPDDDAPAPLTLGGDAHREPSLEVVSLDLGDDEDETPAPRAPETRQPPRIAGEADAGQILGNRPAEGARVVSASEIFSEDFIGAEGASDFLGLDTDFDPTPMAKGFGDLELDRRDDPAGAVATEELLQTGYGAPPISPPDADPDYVEPELGDGEFGDGEFGDDEFGGEFGDGLGGEELDDELLQPSPPPARKRRLLVGAGALALGLAAVGAAIFGPGLLGGDPEPIEVASSGATAPRPQTPTPEPADLDPLDQTSADAETPVQPRPIEDFASSAAATGDETGYEELEAEILFEPVDVAEVVEPVEPDGEAAATDVEGGEPRALAHDAGGSGATIEQLLAESAKADFYGQNAGMLDLVWRGETVPLEAIFATSRILTPSVGPVRIHMATTDVFEGRLFAVGEDKVWVDMEGGRIGLNGSSVARIERLPREAVGSSLPTGDLSLGDRVRAQVPGGVIYGRVRSTVGTSVTLVTDSGARITLDDPVLEPVGDKKSVVLKL